MSMLCCLLFIDCSVQNLVLNDLSLLNLFGCGFTFSWGLLFIHLKGRPLFELSVLKGSNKGLSCFPGGSDGKESACNAGELGLIPGLGRSPGGGNGNPLQYSCLENSMDRGAWQVTVQGVAKSWTRLSG